MPKTHFNYNVVCLVQTIEIGLRGNLSNRSPSKTFRNIS